MGGYGLGLASVLYLSLLGPAAADFDDAVTAYERGNFQEAKSQFESLAAAGDRRAETYIELIDEQLFSQGGASESFFASLERALSSLFNEFDEAETTGPFAAGSGASPAAGNASGDDGQGEPASAAGGQTRESKQEPNSRAKAPGPLIAKSRLRRPIAWEASPVSRYGIKRSFKEFD